MTDLFGKENDQRRHVDREIRSNLVITRTSPDSRDLDRGSTVHGCQLF